MPKVSVKWLGCLFVVLAAAIETAVLLGLRHNHGNAAVPLVDLPTKNEQFIRQPRQLPSGQTETSQSRQKAWAVPNAWHCLPYTAIEEVDDDVIGGVMTTIRKKHPCHIDASIKLNHTWLRSPDRRIQAKFWRLASLQSTNQPSQDEFRAFLKTQKADSMFRKLFGGNNSASAESLLRKMSFVGIYERLEESLVVMKLLFGFPWREILFLRKNENYGVDGPACYPFIEQPDHTPYSSDLEDWMQMNRKDQELYDEATVMLNATIEALGPKLIQRQLNLFRMILQHAEGKCLAKTIMACDMNGKRNNQHSCYKNNVGCGQMCLEELDLNVLLSTTEAIRFSTLHSDDEL